MDGQRRRTAERNAVEILRKGNDPNPCWFRVHADSRGSKMAGMLLRNVTIEVAIARAALRRSPRSAPWR